LGVVPGKLFVLVPPSEAKTSGGSRATTHGTFDDVLLVPRDQVLAALSRLLGASSPALRARTLQVRGALLERALEATRSLVEGRAQLMPAWRRYSGVVWSHLEPLSMTPAQRRRVLVPSGLYGVTTGVDLVADYRLKMDVGLSPLGNIASHWRPHVATALAIHANGATVVNLLPTQHARAIDFKALGANCRVVDVAFVQAGGAGAAGHSAKAAKGVLARRLVEQGIASLETFEWEGWRSEQVDGSVRIVAP
jgi:cytoplasmic iron level regulating protein YaaA (DUF328/UPF0246 family)